MSHSESFNDLFGPIILPGSSSSTSEWCRIGTLARKLLGEAPREERVTLDAKGSSVDAFGVMAEVRAALAHVSEVFSDDGRLVDDDDATESGRLLGVVREARAVRHSPAPREPDLMGGFS